MRRVIVPLLLATTLAACKSDLDEPGWTPLDKAATANEDVLTGKVLEQIPAAPYLYLRLDTGKDKVWAAVSIAEVKTGEQVTVASPMLMKNFESTSLKRTFDEIYFGSLAPAGGAGAAAGGDPHAGLANAAAPVNVGTVARAEGRNARTVAETWAEKSKLDGKSVTIRGVVVKVNEGVMGKNWIHLQDGSGDAAAGTSDITVVSLDKATAGETVTITGTVRTNRDLGAGYTYKVLVEDAKVVKN